MNKYTWTGPVLVDKTGPPTILIVPISACMSESSNSPKSWTLEIQILKLNAVSDDAAYKTVTITDLNVLVHARIQKKFSDGVQLWVVVF